MHSLVVLERLAQPFPYSLEERENIQMTHFSSRALVHDGGGIISYFVLYLFSLIEDHNVSRRFIPSFIFHEDVLAATCSLDFGYSYDGLWGKPHASWCAPLAPNCDFMFHLMRRCCGSKQVASTTTFTFYFEAGQGCTVQVPRVEL